MNNYQSWWYISDTLNAPYNARLAVDFYPCVLMCFNVLVFLLLLRIWGYRKWVIWREFSRELRIWPRPLWLTSNPEADATGEGKTNIPLTSVEEFGSTTGSEGEDSYSRRAGFLSLCWESLCDVVNEIQACLFVLWCQNDSWDSWRKCKRKSWIFTKKKKKAISKLITIHSTQSGMQLTILLTGDLLSKLW